MISDWLLKKIVAIRINWIIVIWYVKGFWLIFALFPFALAYAIYMWRGQRAAEQVELKFKKVD